MMDEVFASPEPTRPASNVLELTVSELSGALKRTIEDRFGFVRVRGEISNYRGPHASGHAYFCLKDTTARIDAVIWRTAFQRLKVKPQEGLEVIATGRVTTYPGKSAYQIIIETIEPAGVGALMALLDSRRRALAAEGLFDAARKTALPFLPAVIGVVTSPTGSVIRDILHRIADRFPRHVVVWPVRVQGETAASEVAAAIAGFCALAPGGKLSRPDVIIVARGGGSLEDLWTFNEEIVVRAAAASTIPLIAGIGHETDTTLIDHAADLRAPTPSGAAEKAVPVRADLVAELSTLSRRQQAGLVRTFDRWRHDMRSLARALPNADAIVAPHRQRLDRARDRLQSASVSLHDRRQLDLARLAQRLSRQAPRLRLAGRRGVLAGLEQRLRHLVERGHERRTRALALSSQRLKGAAQTIDRDIARRRDQRLVIGRSLDAAMAAGLARHADRVARGGRLLETLGYRQILARGFTLVRSSRGIPLHSAMAAARETSLDIEFGDGHISVNAPASRRARPGGKDEQGRLF